MSLMVGVWGDCVMVSKWVVRTNSGCLEMLCNHVCLCTTLPKASIKDDRHKVTALEGKMFKVRVLGGKGGKRVTGGNNGKN